MDYNDNAENTEIITNNQTWNGVPFHLAGKHLMSPGNDVIRNRPVRFNSTSSTDNFIGCINITDNQPWNMDSSDEKDNQTYRNDKKLCSDNSPTKKRPDLNMEGTKNQVTWQQLSPKKEKKTNSQSSSGSSSSSQSSPTRSWKSDSSEVNKNQVTWRDVSPTKGRKNKDNVKHSPEHVCVSPSKIQSVNQNEIRNLQFSPEHAHAGSKKKITNQNEIRKIQCSPEHACTKNVRSNQNELNSQFGHGTGTACPCHCGKKTNEKSNRTDSATKATNQNADNSQGNNKCSDKNVNPAAEDAFNNDYFYDEDFTVQFDTNLRESSPGLNCTCIDPALMLDFPHMLTGSYLSFNNIKGSTMLDQNTTDIFCPDESELSCSRNSAMDVSTSEREMMCSSDMLDFSDNPIFTPSPTREERANPEIVSTDSLDKFKGQNQSLELSMSQTSSTGHLCMDCCPRKDAYFLSFDGSGQGRSASTSDIENSTNSFGSGQGQARYHHSDISTGSGEEMEDECSDSFHFCFTNNQTKPQSSAGKRFQTLGALHEKPLERSQNSDELRIDCLKKSLSPKKDSKNVKNSANKVCLMCSPKKVESQGKSVSNGNSPSRSSSWARSKPKGKTSWKQIKTLRKLGKVQNGFDSSKSNSMPELCLCSWPSISSQGHHDLHSVAESFHGKRHSAYLLELYQRIKNQSNPVSPEAMANIEQILFQPMVGQNHLHGDKGFLKLDEHCCELCKEDSRSSHTLTNSRVNPGGGHHLESATRKRILEWLDKEKGQNGIQSKCCQTEIDKKTKETLISPVTVTLWCGTKNFGSQFPPASRDCAIQTSVLENSANTNNTHDAMQQTSPLSERNAILAMLPKDFSELEDILPHTQLKPKNHVPRSKSADDSSCHGNKTLSMQNQNNSFYSHKSLPDLSFLSPKSCQQMEHECSIFDPLPNPVPIPALVPTVEHTKSGDSGRSSPRLQHHCRGEAKPHCGSNHRSRSAPSRLINQALTRNFAESGSSSSGFSTSSTSSGIDPGYCEPRSIQTTSPYCYRDNTSPSNDIERLLFYPPHVESSVKKDNSCRNDQVDTRCFQVHQQQTAQRQHLAKKSRLSDKVVNKYANEIFPNSSESKQKILASHKTNHDNVSGSSSNSSLHLEHLYSLQEEQTPLSSPEQHHSHEGCHSNTYCYHDNTYCEVGTYGYCQYEQNVNCGSDWDQTQEVILRRKFDLDIGSHLSSESGSSSSSSLIPNFDRKPLKSCLRKKQFLRSRSMSDPFSLLQQLDQQREARKINRHSYACEEVYLLTDETGEYFLYQNDSETEEPVLFYQENNEDNNTQTVKRRQKNVENETSGEQSDKDLSGKRKSVSFASEVSFHAISPQMSPKRQTDEQGQPESCCHDNSDCVEDKTLIVPDSTTESVESSDSDTPPTEFKVSTSPPDEMPVIDVSETLSPKRSSSEPSLTEQLDRKRAMLTALSDAAECLLNHFAEAKNPFDKLRLGNSADTPEVAELVLTKLSPLICQLLSDGLKQYVTGVHVFGRVKVTVWKVAEASAELGPYTRAIHELVQQLKANPGLVSCTHKFDAFIFGLLNLRLLDFWIGYLKHNESITKKFYNTDGVVLLGQSYLQMAFDQMLISLQPLAILPFQLGFEFIVQRSALKTAEKSPLSSPITEQTKPLNSPTEQVKLLRSSPTAEKKLIQDDKNANQVPPAKPPRLQQNTTMFSATKAWDWLKGSSNQEGSSSVLPKTSEMMSSITEMFGKLTGKTSDSNAQIIKSSEIKECNSVEKKVNSAVGSIPVSKEEPRSAVYPKETKLDIQSRKTMELEQNGVIDIKIDQQSVKLNTKPHKCNSDDSEKDKCTRSESSNFGDNMNKNDMTIKAPSLIESETKTNKIENGGVINHVPGVKPNPCVVKQDTEDCKTQTQSKEQVGDTRGCNSVPKMADQENNVTDNLIVKQDINTEKTNVDRSSETAMKRSLTDLAQNLFGRTPNTYKKGVTEYNFNTDKEQCNNKKTEVKASGSKSKPEFARSRSLVEGDACQNVKTTESSRKSSLELPQLEGGDVTTKTKSGIIKLFDKLLLPRQSQLKQPQPIGKSFSSGELQPQPIKSSVSTADSPQMRSKDSVKKTKYRWSWSLGQNKNKYASDLPASDESQAEKSMKNISSNNGQKGKEISQQDTKKQNVVKNNPGTKLPRQTAQPKPKERRNSYIYTDYTKVNKEVSDKGQFPSNKCDPHKSSSECVSLESGPVVKAPGTAEGKTSKNGKKASKIGKLIVQPKTEQSKGDNQGVTKPGKSSSVKKGSSLSG